MDGWMDGWMVGWMGGGKSWFKDCLQQSKIIKKPCSSIKIPCGIMDKEREKRAKKKQKSKEEIGEERREGCKKRGRIGMRRDTNS